MDTEGLEALLLSALEEPTAVLCVGNPLRGDDGFGPAVARELADLPQVIDAGTTPENELPRAARGQPRSLLLVDAVHFGGRPGQLRVMSPGEMRFDDFSTHGIPLEMCARFMESACGAKTVVLACQPADTRLGAPLSPEVEAAVEETARLLRRVLT